jgi:uncharacterized protein YkwD
VAECTVCERETAVSDACPHCAAPVCSHHRPPAAHNCPGVDGDETAGWYTDPDAGRGPDERGDAAGDPSTVSRLSDPRHLAAGVVVVLLLAAAGVGVLAATGPPTADLNETAIERQVAAGANAERTERGRARLTYDAALAAVAANHSRDMLERDYFDHVSPDGVGPGDRYERAGIDCDGGENIYLGPNAERFVDEGALAGEIVRSLMASKGHREAILDPDYERQGVGVVVGPDGAVYVTQDFC